MAVDSPLSISHYLGSLAECCHLPQHAGIRFVEKPCLCVFLAQFLVSVGLGLTTEVYLRLSRIMYSALFIVENTETCCSDAVMSHDQDAEALVNLHESQRFGQAA